MVHRIGTNAAELFAGTNDRDIFSGEGGNDVLIGFGDDDSIQGGRGDDRIFGGEGNDSITGGEGSDIIVGGNGNNQMHGDDPGNPIDGSDLIIGGPNADGLYGGAGDDILVGGGGANNGVGGSGNDVLVAGLDMNQSWAGGADTDVLIVPYKSTDVKVVFETGSILIGGKLYISFESIEKIIYADSAEYAGLINDLNTLIASATRIDDVIPAAPAQVQTVGLIYEAGLGRSADAPGLNYWIKQYAAGTSLQTIAGGFLDSAEFTNRYGDDDTMTATRFVNVMYQNVLGRTPDASGLSYWVDSMGKGMSREQVLIGFAGSPENVAKSSVSSLIDSGGGYWDFL